MFQVVTPPTEEPVSVQEVRVHLREGGDADSPGDSPAIFESLPDDSWIADKITAAREACEQFLGYPLTDAIYRLILPDFTGRSPAEISRSRSMALTSPLTPYLKLPEGIADVESISYLNTANVVQTLSPTTYTFDPVTRLVFADAWPALSSRPGAVRLLVRGAYGYDSPPLPVPQAVRHAILLMVGEWYVNREASVDARQADATLGVEYLLRPLRTRLGMA